MAERDIVAAILRLLRKTPNCFCWKEHGGMYGTAGIPDVIAWASPTESCLTL